MGLLGNLQNQRGKGRNWEKKTTKRKENKNYYRYIKVRRLDKNHEKVKEFIYPIF